MQMDNMQFITAAAGHEEAEYSSNEEESENRGVVAALNISSARLNLSPMEEFAGFEPLVNVSMVFEQVRLSLIMLPSILSQY